MKPFCTSFDKHFKNAFCLIYLDPYILRELKPWKKEFHVISRQVISATDVALDNDNCRYAECTMGLVIADAFLNSYRISRNNRQDNEDEISVAFIQAGGVRASIPEGRKD